MNNLREVLSGPMHTGRWTQYWKRRRDGKVRRFMKILWMIFGIVALLAFVGLGVLLAALIVGV